ncbi:hypothetical protein L2725_15275 [Shewanella corallii]|uniref:DUF3995 domain-containing protein n=1 Tax=Shewanella corallii TaxID=560080 RepID=A0ABT0N9S5_9GAMM|nr:hypothetical protein [Shewanella corallii]MCL2915120.1 hypothetical protein [Shewanella corallii]
MRPMLYNLLFWAGIVTFLASLAHIAIIIGGPDWYRFFGAGEGMAKMAEAGEAYPAIMTAGIALVLAIWGAYAWSGAGVIPALPLRRLILIGIAGVFLLRALAGLVLPWLVDHPALAANSNTFWMVSSVICLMIGLLYAFGLKQNWHQLVPV